MAIPLSFSCSKQTAKSIVRLVNFGDSKHLAARSFMGADCDSDHYLVIVKVNIDCRYKKHGTFMWAN